MGNRTPNTPDLVTQAEFARAMGVSRKTVTIWKSEGRIIMVGDRVDLAASRREIEGATTKLRAARRGNSNKVTTEREGNGEGNSARSKVTPGAGRDAMSLEPARAEYVPPRDFGNPANLPSEVTAVATMIEAGAVDLGRILASRLPPDDVRAIVGAWVDQARIGWVGSPGASATIADEAWPPAPVGYQHWGEHPLFSGPVVSAADWADILQPAPTAPAS